MFQYKEETELLTIYCSQKEKKIPSYLTTDAHTELTRCYCDFKIGDWSQMGQKVLLKFVSHLTSEPGSKVMVCVSVR